MTIRFNKHIIPVINYQCRTNREDYRNNSLEYLGYLPVRRAKRVSPLSSIGEGLLKKALIVVAVMSLGLLDLNELRKYLWRA